MIKIKHKGLKIILLIALILVIILTTILIIVNNNINSIVSAKIKEDFKNSEYSKYYELNFNNLRVNTITGTIRFSNVEFIPKEDADTIFFYNNGKYNIKIKTYILKGADIYKYIETDTVNVELIKIIEPEIEITEYKKKIKNDMKEVFFISPFVEVKKISVKKGKFTKIDNYSSSNKTVENVNILIKQFQFISNEKQRNLHFGEADIKLKNIRLTKNDGKGIKVENFNIKFKNLNTKKDSILIRYTFDNFIVEANNLETSTDDYNILVKNINADFKKKDIELTDFKLTPHLSKQKFTKKYKYQKELFDININMLKIENIEIDSLIYNQTILAKNIIIKKGNIKIYNDQTKPLDLNKFPLLPNQTIIKIPNRINIKKIETQDINILIESKTKDGRNGFVDLNINTEIKNINNIDLTKPLLISVNGYIHNIVPFNVNLRFNYNIEGFAYNGKIKSFDLTKLNDIVSSYYPVVIKSGNVKSINFKGLAKNGVSKGNMEFRYNKLKLKFLTEEDKSDIQYYKNNLLSFTANTIILSNNPSSNTTPLRDIDFIFERDKNKGIGNYLFKSFFTGITETIMPNKENRKKYSDKRKNAKHNNLSVVKP